MDIAISKNGIPIRLTSERWWHIISGHPEIEDYYLELLETNENPIIIYGGNNDAKIAVKQVKDEYTKFVVVIYKKVDRVDGFVVTAYLTTKQKILKKENILWKQ